MPCLVPHPVAHEWEEHRVDRAPRDEDAEVETKSRMEIEQYLSTAFHHCARTLAKPKMSEAQHTLMQRKRISPIIEFRLDIDVVEGRRHVRDDPEDQP